MLPCVFLWSSHLSAADAATNAFGTLRGRVVDGATGASTACTVTVVDAAGKTVVPNRAFTAGLRSDGSFELQLPSGPARIKVTRGFETRAVERAVQIPAGGEVEVELKLERQVDLRARGWYAGDSHAHMIHGERTLPVSFDDVAIAARAEDLQYLSLAQAWTLENPTPERLAAELRARSTHDCVLTWNLEAPKNYYGGDAGKCLGHCWMVGVEGRTATGADVLQLLMQASAHDYESEKPTYANFESHRLIHAQGGTVFYTHPARWWTGEWGGKNGFPKREQMRISNLAVELPLDTILGPTFDGIDVITGPGEFSANAMAFDLWCLLLNKGYRVAATASSDSCFDRLGGGIPGVVRTYTYLPDGFSIAKVARAMAEGRNFVTSGPLLLTSLDGQPPGTAVPADGTTRTLKIEAWPSGADPGGLTRLELLRNGSPIVTNSFNPPLPSFATNVPLSDASSAWYCVRVFGSDPVRQRAISGAFFLDATPHVPPEPVRSRVRVLVEDADTGEKLTGKLTEVTYHGPVPVSGRVHDLADGEIELEVPATVRLRAEVPGYQPVTKSIVLDNPALVDFVTNLSAEGLVKWETFERTRTMVERVQLVFKLEREW